MSDKQKKISLLVEAIYKKKVSPKTAVTVIKKQHLSREKLEEIIGCLKSLKSDELGIRGDITGNSSTGGSPIEPMYLDEEEDDTQAQQNPITNTFTQTGKKFEEYIGEFDGLPFSPKEADAIYLHQTEPITPTKEDQAKKTPIRFVKYQKSDDFNSTTTIILKQRQGNDLIFTAFQLNKPAQEAPVDTAKPEEKPEGDNIQVSKSKSFRDEIEGGKVLADMLEKLNV
jgi:hypothetical protein